MKLINSVIIEIWIDERIIVNILIVNFYHLKKKYVIANNNFSWNYLSVSFAIFAAKQYKTESNSRNRKKHKRMAMNSNIQRRNGNDQRKVG